MVSEHSIPPVPRIPELLVRSASHHCFTPVSSISLPADSSYKSHGRVGSNSSTTSSNKTKKRRPAASIRSSSKGSIKSSRSLGSSLWISGSASDAPHRSRRPKLQTSSSYDIKTLQFKRNEARKCTEGMKETSLLKNLMLKEPSSTALDEFAESERRRAALGAKKQQRAGVASVSSRQLPQSVPKVNTKWDGMPESVDGKRMADGSIKSSAASIRTATSMQRSTASSIMTSRSQPRDISTRFSETLNKFPTCPQGVPQFLSAQSVGYQAKSQYRNSVGTSVTTTSLPLSVEDEKLRYPWEKVDLIAEPEQRVEEAVAIQLSQPSSPLPVAQVNISKETIGSEVVENGQLTRILVSDDGEGEEKATTFGSPSRSPLGSPSRSSSRIPSGNPYGSLLDNKVGSPMGSPPRSPLENPLGSPSRSPLENSLGSPSRTRAATITRNDENQRLSTNAIPTLPQASESAADVIPPALLKSIEQLEESLPARAKPVRNRRLRRWWRKIFKR